MSGYATKIGPYKIEQLLAQGGFGRVYRGTAPDGAPVAIKVIMETKRLPPELRQLAHRIANRRSQDAVAIDANQLKRLEGLPSQERVMAARLDREEEMLKKLGDVDGFVDWLGSGELADGRPYFVMPFMPGGTLRDRLAASGGVLSIDETIKIGKAVALTMRRAHEHGIVHRDLKPDNVLFDVEDRPVISDLGTAKCFLNPGELTRTGDLQGTPAYMAPEQIEDAKRVGPPADVYSIGVMLYECLTGTCPVKGTIQQIVVRAVEGGKHDSIRELRPETPKWLVEIVERCIAHDPATRYADGGELASALVNHQAREARSAELGGDRSRQDRGLRGRWALVGVSATVLAGVGALTFFAASNHTPELKPSPEVKPTPSSAEKLRSVEKPPTKIEEPTWYRELPEDEQPRYPLPKGVRFGSEARTYMNDKDSSELVFVSGGTFIMGTNEGQPCERPAHDVELSPFFIGKLEVTNRQFAAFVKATGYKTTAERNPSAGERAAEAIGNKDPAARDETWKNPFRRGPPPEDHPVVCVSWFDAEAYVKWAGLTLPTEAQWERAAAWDPKSGKSRRYSWGESVPGKGSSKVANLGDESWLRSHPVRGARIFEGYDDGFPELAPVGTFLEGVSPCGAFDMTGNASEWCADSAESATLPPYEDNKQRDPFRPTSGKWRIYRGANFRSGPAATNQYRGYNGQAIEAERFSAEIGFRVALPVGR